jgi:hypothetical protein
LSCEKLLILFPPSHAADRRLPHSPQAPPSTITNRSPRQATELPRAAVVRRTAAAAFLEREQPLALVAPFLEEVGEEDPIVHLAGERQLPVVGAISLHPRQTSPPDRYVFYIYGGAGLQGGVQAMPSREVGPAGHAFAQRTAAAAGQLFVEMLIRMHPERLVDELEQLRDFGSPHAPPLTFGKNRHIGAPEVEVALDEAGGHLYPKYDTALSGARQSPQQSTGR